MTKITMKTFDNDKMLMDYCMKAMHRLKERGYKKSPVEIKELISAYKDGLQICEAIKKYKAPA